MLRAADINTSRKNAKAIFAAVCQAANSLDKEAVLKLKENNYHLDILDDRQLHTPAGLLAREKNHAAVLLLIELGADAGMAAMGAASVGDVEFAEFLRKRHGASIHALAKGAAMHSDSTYAQHLLRKYPGIELEIMFGYAVRSTLCNDLVAQFEIERYSQQLRAEFQAMMDPLSEETLLMAKKLENLSEIHAFGMTLGLDISAYDTKYFLQSASPLAETLRDKFAGTANDVILHGYNFDAPFIQGMFAGFVVQGAFSAAAALEKALIDHHFQNFLVEQVPLFMERAAASFDMFPNQLHDNGSKKLIFHTALASGHINSVLENRDKLLPGEDDDADVHRAARKKVFPVEWLHEAAIKSLNVELFQKFTSDKEFLRKFGCKFEKISWGNFFDCLEILGEHMDKTSSGKAIRFLSEIADEISWVKKSVLLIYIMRMIKQVAVNYGEDYLIHLLSFMNADVLKVLTIFELDKDYPEAANQIRIAWKINTCMHKYDFDFDQAKEFVENKDLRNSLSSMMFKPLISNIPLDVNIKILSVFTALEHGAIKDMLAKYRYQNQSTFLLKDESLWWHQRRIITKEVQSDVKSLPELHGFFHRKAAEYGAKRKVKLEEVINRHINRLG